MTITYYCPPAGVKTVPVRWAVRVYRALYRISPYEALNCTETQEPPSLLPDEQLAANLRQAINHLTGAGVNLETGRVDYQGLRASEAFEAYTVAVCALCDFDPFCLTDHQERLAFWINLYNALIIHAIIAYDVKEKITEIGGIFERAAYILGGYRLSADDIEHGILRANAGHPAMPGPRFGASDPRRELCMATIDPRIHFALNCGAESCPPIGFYQADQLDRQLDLAARHFAASGGVQVDRDQMVVRLSRIFSWYASDFGGRWFGRGGRADLLRTVSAYLNEDTGQFVRKHAGRLRISFLPYDWSLNT